MASDDSSNEHDFVSPAHCDACMQSWLPPGSVPEGEPPMTPEEEEELAEGGTLPPPEGPEYTPCVCGHIEPDHDTAEGKCFECGCSSYITRAELDEEAECKGCGQPWDKRHTCPPPQPLRRPPYAVAYSVQGHLYEVALPGDATVKAVDGALIIQHHLGPVAGIVQVLPVINEGGAHGAEADQ